MKSISIIMNSLSKVLIELRTHTQSVQYCTVATCGFSQHSHVLMLL